MVFDKHLTTNTLPIFISALCDNLLLTVVVPILPELLKNHGMDATVMANSLYIAANPHLSSDNNATISNYSFHGGSEAKKSCLKDIFHLHLLHENTQLGLLYSTKAFLQLIANPFVGRLTLKIGYKIPLCIGNFILFLCALVYGFADSIPFYTLGRSCHGDSEISVFVLRPSPYSEHGHENNGNQWFQLLTTILHVHQGLASSLISICGMAIVAQSYQDDEVTRTKVLGRVMGAAALGVLIGYPFGGIMFALFGKSMPFLCVALLAAANVAFQIESIGRELKNSQISDYNATEMTELALAKNTVIPGMMNTSIFTLLRNRSICVIVISIWLTTTAMAILEPTLPVWLIENFDPPKWQLGLVFVPDSVGYFIGTNCFGKIALQFGRWKMSMVSMAFIGGSCFMIPLAKALWQLLLPHFALGLALGIVDAALMPLLACFADEYHHVGYGVVYALAQTSVALAYSIGPMIGGEVVPIIGFPDLLRTIGLLNLMFCPMLVLLAHSEPLPQERQIEKFNQYQTFPKHFKIKFYNNIQPQPQEESYQLFNDELDSD